MGTKRGRRPLTRHDRNVALAILVIVVVTAVLVAMLLSMVIDLFGRFMTDR